MTIQKKEPHPNPKRPTEPSNEGKLNELKEGRTEVRDPNLERFLIKTLDYFNITEAELKRRRVGYYTDDALDPQHRAIRARVTFCCIAMFQYSQADVANFLGYNHATVLYYHKSLLKKLRKEPQFLRSYEILMDWFFEQKFNVEEGKLIMNTVNGLFKLEKAFSDPLLPEAKWRLEVFYNRVIK